MRKSVLALAVLASSASASHANVCGSPNNVFMLYETALMAPNRCTNFKPMTEATRVLLLAAADADGSPLSPSCQHERLMLRVRMEDLADNDKMAFCKMARDIFSDNPNLRYLTTGSSTKPKN